MEIDGTFIEAIAALADRAAEKKPQVVQIDGVEFVDRDMKDLRKPKPEPKTLGLHSLRGVTDYAKRALQTSEINPECVIHVLGPATVKVIGKTYGEFKQRDVYAQAEYQSPFADQSGGPLKFGQYVDLETFNIALQTVFEQTEERDALLAFVGNITAETVKNASDDGVSQQVTVRQGITRVQNAVAPNPVTLAPFRSFAEIEQVPSKFILRLQGGREGQLPTAALFQADGGRWRIEAIARVVAFLEAQSSGLTIIS